LPGETAPPKLAPDGCNRPPARIRKGLPIVAYLVFGVSGLVLLSVGGVLLVTLWIATRNTVELLEGKGRRLGLHSGPVVVGNIGTPSRMNYTVVGDTVNTTKHLQELAKELLPNVDVAILVSGVTAPALPPDLRLRSLVEYHLRGRGAPIEVFGLAG
jgi:hypothetical protein